MKRTLLALICLIIVLYTPLSVTATAPKIVDNAGILTDAEITDLEKRAMDLSEQYGIDVVIVTVNSLDGKSSESFADDYYDSNGYGIGAAHSGVLLLLSMEYRDWAISTCGEAIYALTDYGVQGIFSEIAGYLSNNQYFMAFSAYLDALEPYFENYNSGEPIDAIPGGYTGPGTYTPGTQNEIVYFESEQGFQRYLQKIGIAFITGAIVALIVLLIMRSRMNTAKAQRGAASYMLAPTFQIRYQRDIFLYSQLRKVRKSESSSTGGGGSSVHRSSSGRNHGGGHGKF